jgi:hypothetical protein
VDAKAILVINLFLPGTRKREPTGARHRIGCHLDAPPDGGTFEPLPETI